MTPNILFKKAINEITRKTSEAKALPAFKMLLAAEIRRTWRAKFLAFDESDVERTLQENIEYYREKGLEEAEVKKFKRLYAELPWRGPRKKI